MAEIDCFGFFKSPLLNFTTRHSLSASSSERRYLHVTTLEAFWLGLSSQATVSHIPARHIQYWVFSRGDQPSVRTLKSSGHFSLLPLVLLSVTVTALALDHEDLISQI
ncbi:hypothetical protein BP00DRAFT_114572 [Aspergillus indologenus CBS 114.80]|uniref:Uncharacterized protein n=1 Tax=Aspergillus indologenus CBS 114.80 TaxID=1450541 RepID=A0A2V5ICE2_9EURO|nr:hypothetical protein BP00DRAFT_114572 [Aspergillus indologenus CBS 114.80]